MQKGAVQPPSRCSPPSSPPPCAFIFPMSFIEMVPPPWPHGARCAIIAMVCLGLTCIAAALTLKRYRARNPPALPGAGPSFLQMRAVPCPSSRSSWSDPGVRVMPKIKSLDGARPWFEALTCTWQRRRTLPPPLDMTKIKRKGEGEHELESYSSASGSCRSSNTGAYSFFVWSVAGPCDKKLPDSVSDTDTKYSPYVEYDERQFIGFVPPISTAAELMAEHHTRSCRIAHIDEPGGASSGRPRI